MYKPARILIRILLGLAAALINILLLTGVFFFFNGSLEMYPTGEQTEKIKITSAAIVFACLAIDICFIMCRKRLRR